MYVHGRQHASRDLQSDVWNRFVAGRATCSVDDQVGDYVYDIAPNRLEFPTGGSRAVIFATPSSVLPTPALEEIHMYYTASQKTRHQTLGHNFTNYYPIFKIFSLADSVVHLQQIHV